MDAVRAIVWKEYRELVRQPGNVVTSGWRANGLTFLIIGIFLALRYPLPTSGALWGLAMGGAGGFLALIQAADTVAGERERHTLDTLLSTNIPGVALFAAKVAAMTLYGWTLGFVALVGMLAAGTVKAMVQGGGMPPLRGAAAAPLLALPLVVLAALLGVWISARSATVRKAQQTIVILFFSLLALPSVLGLIVTWVIARDGPLAEWLARGLMLMRPLGELGQTGWTLLALAGVLAVDAVLVRLGLPAFKRDRLTGG